MNQLSTFPSLQLPVYTSSCYPQLNVYHSSCPPNYPFFGAISVHPTTHPSVFHSFICTSYYTGACMGRVFFSLTVQKTKCSWGWQQAGQIGAGKWHLLFITANRERVVPRCACDPLTGSLHSGNQRQSDFSQKAPCCSASSVALIRLRPPLSLQYSLIKFCGNEHMFQLVD